MSLRGLRATCRVQTTMILGSASGNEAEALCHAVPFDPRMCLWLSFLAASYMWFVKCDAIEDLVLSCHVPVDQIKLRIRCLWLPEENIARREGQKEFERQSQSFQNFCLKSQAFAAAVSYLEARDFGEYCLEDLAKLQDECRDLTGWYGDTSGFHQDCLRLI